MPNLQVCCDTLRNAQFKECRSPFTGFVCIKYAQTPVSTYVGERDYTQPTSDILTLSNARLDQIDR